MQWCFAFKLLCVQYSAHFDDDCTALERAPEKGHSISELELMQFICAIQLRTKVQLIQYQQIPNLTTFSLHSS